MRADAEEGLAEYARREERLRRDADDDREAKVCRPSCDGPTEGAEPNSH